LLCVLRVLRGETKGSHRFDDSAVIGNSDFGIF
jgi:hypothetical protein